MSVVSDWGETGHGLLESYMGSVTGTYAQAANTKSITTAVRRRPARGEDLDGQLDPDEVLWTVPASEFTSGFSGTNPVNPNSGDTWTVSGERAYRVARAELRGGGAYWLLTTRRQRLKGTA